MATTRQEYEQRDRSLSLVVFMVFVGGLCGSLGTGSPTPVLICSGAAAVVSVWGLVTSIRRERRG